MSRIKVCVRARPGPISPELVLRPETHQVEVLSPATSQLLSFDKVFDSTYHQEELFQEIGGKYLAQQLLGGNSAFVYGQTGAGKTYTLEGAKPGLSQTDARNGLTIRLLQALYDCSQKDRIDHAVQIQVSFLEIYNQKIYDLLSDSDRPLRIRTGVQGTTVEDLKHVLAKSYSTALKAFHKGVSKKRISKTLQNKHSSRSHTILTAGVVSQKGCQQLHLVDLAGSERIQFDRNKHRIKESIQINKSLFKLRQVITELHSKNGQTLEFLSCRDSKLTALLKDSLIASNCLLIACINPSHQYLPETIQTLNYASLTARVRIQRRPSQARRQNFLPALKTLKTEKNMTEESSEIKEYIESISTVKQLITSNIALKSEVQSLKKQLNQLTKQTKQSLQQQQGEVQKRSLRMPSLSREQQHNRKGYLRKNRFNSQRSREQQTIT